MAVHYRDKYLTFDEDGLTIRKYYYPVGDRRITYDEIRRFEERALGIWTGRWRIWGTGDFRHWYHLDTNRPFKSRAFVLETGGRFKSVITPDDPDTVLRLLRERLPEREGKPRS
ncbi:MAG TPA: hypothetical protein DFS52_02350 [Myxococcales bacterium]|jgi:hypothetical protein|nr:hypothetical protein [Myxococcales bacterium]